MRHVSLSLHTKVRQKVQECIEAASDYYDRKFSMPLIVFDVTGRDAGRAHIYDWSVDFNRVLLVENEEDFLERTVPHEIAHLIDYKVNPKNFECIAGTKRKLHGQTFKFIMTHVLGAKDANRCHTYDTSNTRRKKNTVKYQYRCTCGCDNIIELGHKRHRLEQELPGSYRLRGHNNAQLAYLSQRRPINPVVQSQRPKPTQSNKDTARTIFATSHNRGDFISACSKAGIKNTTASTYYQNFKSGQWK